MKECRFVCDDDYITISFTTTMFTSMAMCVDTLTIPNVDKKMWVTVSIT